MLMKSTYFKSPTIVLITDRTDLDDQLSGQFTSAKGFIGDETVISVESRAHLREFLARMLMKSTYFKSPTIVLITDRTDLDDLLS